jgi:hypothetical protein
VSRLPEPETLATQGPSPYRPLNPPQPPRRPHLVTAALGSLFVTVVGLFGIAGFAAGQLDGRVDQRREDARDYAAAEILRRTADAGALAWPLDGGPPGDGGLDDAGMPLEPPLFRVMADGYPPPCPALAGLRSRFCPPEDDAGPEATAAYLRGDPGAPAGDPEAPGSPRPPALPPVAPGDGQLLVGVGGPDRLAALRGLLDPAWAARAGVIHAWTGAGATKRVVDLLVLGERVEECVTGGWGPVPPDGGTRACERRGSGPAHPAPPQGLGVDSGLAGGVCSFLAASGWDPKWPPRQGRRRAWKCGAR